MLNPQTKAMIIERIIFFEKNPMRIELIPLMMSMMILNFRLPILSAIFPPIIFPIAPVKKRRNVITDTNTLGSSDGYTAL